MKIKELHTSRQRRQFVLENVKQKKVQEHEDKKKKEKNKLKNYDRAMGILDEKNIK